MVSVKVTHRKNSNIMQSNTFYLIFITIILMVFYNLYRSYSSIISFNQQNCFIWFGEYKGPKYKSPNQTMGDGKCLLESKWMQVMQHQVRINPELDDVIDDWLFINYHDRINVLVEDPNPISNERHFLVFEQSKYALEGKNSLAIIGGIIEPDEDPLTAAKREVYEEMNGMICATFVFLGRYRTDVNRGMGWVNGFLARNCQLEVGERVIETGEEYSQHQIGAMDTERQDVKSISLSELRKETMKGSFLEVQWSNTVSLALLNMDESSRDKV